MKLVLNSVLILLGIGIFVPQGRSQNRDSTLIEISTSGIRICDVRPTFLEFSVRTLPAINYYPLANQSVDNQFEANKLYNVKLNMPFFLSRKLDIIGQFRYKNEELHLGNDLDANEKEIHFDNLGLSVMFKYHFNQTYYLAGHVGGFFKTDKLTFENYSSILDYNSSVLFGKDLELGTMGFGAVFGNSFGRFRIYPLFLFDYQLSDHWKLEMKLPKEIQVRRILKPDNFYLIGGSELNGSSYFVSQDIYNGIKDLEFRRASIDLKIGIEKEIIDFLWFGTDIGFMQPLYSGLVETRRPTRDKLLDFGNSFTPYASLSLFLVPPKSLFYHIK